MKTHIVKSLLCSIILITTYACNVKDKKTTLLITDTERHYHPVLRGEVLDIVYPIENTGEYPLFISDIKTSCGCMLINESSFKVLPAGGKGFLRIKYDSSKNLGYVKHYITIYANLEEDEKQEVTFDLHVVPNALYTRDYEELHEEKENVKELVDGDGPHLGYYTKDTPW